MLLQTDPRPPGPAGGLLGLAPLLAYRKDPLGHVTRLAREYGDVTYTRVGRWHAFLLSHPDHVEHVLVRRRGTYGKDPLLLRMRPLLGQGLLTSDGARWAAQRRLMAPAFTAKRVAGYAGVMLEEARALMREWAPGQVRDVGGDMARLTLEVAVRTLFGTSAREETRAVTDALAVVSDHYGHSLGRLRWPEFVPTARNRAFKRALAELDRVVARIVAARAAAPEGEDLLGRLLAARDAQGAGMSPTQVRDEVLTLLLAGHETTALLLTYTWQLLGLFPDVAARLTRELALVLGERDPTPEDLPRLVTTDHVLQESLRLYPPAAILGRQALAPDEIAGWRIPAGALVFFAPWVLQRDPRFFPEPEAFRPERWAEPAIADLPRFAYFPFGGGERVCIGEAFARLEARLVLATLARRWRFEPLPDAPPMVVTPEITLRPTQPVRMRLVSAV